MQLKVEGRQEGKKARKQGETRITQGALGNGLRHAADWAVGRQDAATKEGTPQPGARKARKRKGSVMVNLLHAATQDDENGNGDD